MSEGVELRSSEGGVVLGGPGFPVEDGQVMVFDAASGKWFPQTPSTGGLPDVTLLGRNLVTPAVPAPINLEQHHLYQIGLFMQIEPPPGADGTFVVTSPSGELARVLLNAGSQNVQALQTVWAEITDGANQIVFTLEDASNDQGYLTIGWVTVLDLGLQE